MPNVPAISLPTAGAFGYAATSDPTQNDTTHQLIGGGSSAPNQVVTTDNETIGFPQSQPLGTNVIMTGTFAQMGSVASPAAGMLFFTTDTFTQYRYNGSLWVAVGAGLNGSGIVPTGELGTGTANSTTFLRGDSTWQVVSGSGSQLSPTAVKTTNYTAAANDLVVCDTQTTGAFTVTLPTAPADKTTIGVILVKQSGTNAITIATGGTDVFDVAGGSTTANLGLLFQTETVQYQSSTGIWFRVTNRFPRTQLYASFSGDATVNGSGVITLANSSGTRTNLGLGSIATVNSPVPIANGGTGQTAQQAAFDALSPTTTAGDLIYNNGTHNVNFAIGNTWQELGSTGSAPSWKNRSRQILSGSGGGAGSLTTNTTIFGGFQNILAANEYQVGDIIRVRVGVTLSNQSGGSATMYVSLAFRNNGGTATQTTNTLSTLSVATVTTRTGWIDFYGVITAITGSNVTITFQAWSNICAAGASAIVVASTTSSLTSVILPGGGGVTGAIDFDIEATSSVNAVNVTAAPSYYSVEKLAV